jgi:hypothetical protein
MTVGLLTQCCKALSALDEDHRIVWDDEVKGFGLRITAARAFDVQSLRV